MKRADLLAALRRLKVETGSLACLGCGHELNCGISGCAILQEAEQEIAYLTATVERLARRLRERDESDADMGR